MFTVCFCIFGMISNVYVTETNFLDYVIEFDRSFVEFSADITVVDLSEDGDLPPQRIYFCRNQNSLSCLRVARGVEKRNVIDAAVQSFKRPKEDGYEAHFQSSQGEKTESKVFHWPKDEGVEDRLVRTDPVGGLLFGWSMLPVRLGDYLHKHRNAVQFLTGESFNVDTPFGKISVTGSKVEMKYRIDRIEILKKNNSYQSFQYPKTDFSEDDSFVSRIYSYDFVFQSNRLSSISYNSEQLNTKDGKNSKRIRRRNIIIEQLNFRQSVNPPVCICESRFKSISNGTPIITASEELRGIALEYRDGKIVKAVDGKALEVAASVVFTNPRGEGRFRRLWWLLIPAVVFALFVGVRRWRSPLRHSVGKSV
jgi:hypothetical protein